MGQKVHPTGFRIGIIYGWQSKWFADHDYKDLLLEDLKIRDYLEESMRDAAVARVEIERNANMVTVTIHTAKPGIVIGRGGQKVDELRGKLESLTSKRIRVNIQEIRMPELDANLVARNIADQLERRVAFRRALRQTVSRTMARGAQGCKAMVAGRLGGIEMSRTESTMEGRVPLHTMRADIDYGQAEAATTFGRIGVKVWIYKGDRLPERREVVVTEARSGDATDAPAASAPATTKTPAAAASAPAETPATTAEAPATATPAPAETPATTAEAPATATPAPAETPLATPEVTTEPAAAETPATTAEAPATATPAPTETPLATPEVTTEPAAAETPATTAEAPATATPAPAETPAAAPEATTDPADETGATEPEDSDKA